MACKTESLSLTSPKINWSLSELYLFPILNCFFSSRLKITIFLGFKGKSRSTTALPKEPVPPVTRMVLSLIRFFNLIKLWLVWHRLQILVLVEQSVVNGKLNPPFQKFVRNGSPDIT